MSTGRVLEETFASFGTKKLPTIWWSKESHRDQGRSIDADAYEFAAALAAAYLQIRSLEVKVATLQEFVIAK